MRPPAVFKKPMFKPRVGPRRPRRTLPRLSGLSVNRILPNAITVLALCSGLSAIRFAIDGHWRTAMIAVLFAAIFDAMDGRVARMLNGQSNFGAELDSLSDVVSFGVAPAIMLYLWTLHEAGGFGWVSALAFAVCCALRLARFNARLGETDRAPWAYNYFTGVPAPAGAGLALLPMTASFATDWASVGHPVIVVPWTLAAAGLMVSTLPTFSFKGVRVPQHYVVPALAAVGLLAASLASQPWWTMTLIGLAYIATIPFSVRQYRRLLQAAALIQTTPGEPAPAEAGDEAAPPCPPTP